MESEIPLSSEEELTESESDYLVPIPSLRFKKRRHKRKRCLDDEETESNHDNAYKAPTRAVQTRKRTFSSTLITNTTTTTRSRRRAVSNKPKNNKAKEDTASLREDSDIELKPKKSKTKKRKRGKKQNIFKEPAPKRVKRLKL
eukprot:389487_1